MRMSPTAAAPKRRAPWGGPGLLTAASACALLAGVPAIVGCAAPERRAAVGPSSFPRQAAAAEERPSPMVGFDCLLWFVPSSQSLRADALARARERGLLSARDATLAGNGFEVFTVERARLAELLALLGEARYTRSTMLGQPLEWTDLATTPLEPGLVMFAGGRPRPTTAGVLRLAFRGWCFPTVDGARARVELRVGEDESRVQSVTIDPSQARPRLADLPGGRLALELGPDQALVIAAKPIDPPSESEKGPESLAPPTAAALLLDRSPFPDRATILVLVPSMADILPPKESAGR